MKLLIFLLTAFFLKLSATGISQNMSISANNLSLKQAFAAIKKQTGYMVFYNEALLGTGKKIDVHVKDMPLKDFLDEILETQDLKFSMVNKNILITRRPKEEVVVVEKTAIAAPPVIGVVRDSTGAPLVGVTISIKGTATSTMTDGVGRYELLVKENAVLIFSMVGFEPQEIAVNGRGGIDVILKHKDTSMEDVVITAFSNKVKKTDMVGSVTSIKPEELKIPSSNLTTALAGRLAGVIAFQRSGEPGADNADFFIRGVTTFGYKKDPLILIDNMEVTVTDLARLQVDDIEGFSIMKDATATAVYGARGANGVVLITTKQGKEGKPRIGFRMENSISKPTRKVELADPITYMRLHNEALQTRLDAAPLYSEERIQNTINNVDPYLYPVTDWQKVLIKDQATTQRVNLNLNGGGVVAKYFVSGALNRDNGLLRQNGKSNFNSNIALNSYSLRSNVNISLSKTTEMVVRLSGSFDDYSGPIPGGSSVFGMTMNANPVLFPAFYENAAGFEHIKHVMFGNFEKQGDYLNPYAEVVKGYKETSRSNMYAQLELNQNLAAITEGLSFRMMGNTTRFSYFDLSRSYSPYYYSTGSIDRTTGKALLYLMNETQGAEFLNYTPGAKDVSSAFYFEAAMNYNRKFEEKHTVTGMLVSIFRNSLNGNATVLQESLPFRNLGLSGKATYSYDSRYHLDLNFGYNGSERFSKKNRFGFFPSAGVAWSVSNESFWLPFQHVVSKLRLRATYGLVGNDQIGAPSDRFFYLSEVNLKDDARGSEFGNNFEYKQPGISVSRYANSDISWEVAYKSNIAIELTLFNKFEFIAEYFKDSRKKILMERLDIPKTMGLASAVKGNVGEAVSSGFEASLSFDERITPEWWIQAQGNFTYATGKYKVYEELDYGVDYLKKVGKPLSQQFGYIAERLFINEKEVHHAPQQLLGAGRVMGGDIKYVDINGDGAIDQYDIVPIGYPTTPEIVYGFGFSTGYKNFDFSAFFQGLARESFWIDADGTAPFKQTGTPGKGNQGNKQLLKAYADNHWSEENQNLYALYPRLSIEPLDNNTVSSTWWMRDGAFLRLKQVEFGYTLSRTLTQKVKISKLRVYFNTTNPIMWSKFKLWDVEMAGKGLGYPIQKVFNLGVNLSM